MSVADAKTAKRVETDFDPEDYRMSLGEHLEELRKRVVLGLYGMVIAVVGCLIWGDQVVVFFCRPLIDGLRDAGMNTQLYNTNLVTPFMLYIKVSLIVALAIASPWILFQLWLFVSAGLYPSERRVVRRFIPLSILLLIAGMAMAYLVVMPLTVRFLLTFNTAYGVGLSGTSLVASDAATRPTPVTIPALAGDPTSPAEGEIWFNTIDSRIKLFIQGHTVAFNYAPDQLLASVITMDTYVDLTLMTLVVFGLAFQLPLVVLALFKVGVLQLDVLRRSRRVVYFALAIAAAVIAPGDVATTMIALWVPLIVLYEFGILLCVWTGGTPEPAD
jgi:sec-independent protein translocase protein TatC